MLRGLLPTGPETMNEGTIISDSNVIYYSGVSGLKRQTARKSELLCWHPKTSPILSILSDGVKRGTHITFGPQDEVADFEVLLRIQWIQKLTSENALQKLGKLPKNYDGGIANHHVFQVTSKGKNELRLVHGTSIDVDEANIDGSVWGEVVTI